MMTVRLNTSVIYTRTEASTYIPAILNLLLTVQIILYILGTVGIITVAYTHSCSL